MRVIAGTCRGKKLAAPPGVTTRPTSDRVKEALFSILASRIDFADVRVLDICAGTGSLGIEALSRGAMSCCFIESNLSVKPILEKNITATCCQDRSEVFTMYSINAFDSELYARIPEALDSFGLLTPGSILVAECSVRNPLLESYGRLKRFDRRLYGDTALELFTLEEK